MRIYEHFNQSTDARCPICGTNEDKPVALVPISGTQEGSICQAIQMHFDCIELVYCPVPGGHAAVGMGFEIKGEKP